MQLDSVLTPITIMNIITIVLLRVLTDMRAASGLSK